MDFTTTIDERVHRTQTFSELNDVRLIEDELKRKSPPQKLGDVTKAVLPFQDVEAIYLAMCGSNLLKAKVANNNRLKAVIRDYNITNPDHIAKLGNYQHHFESQLDSTKRKLERWMEDNELANSICRIKGISPWQIAMIMLEVKDVRRFATPSKLMVYSGVAEMYGMKICKANLHAIEEIRYQRYTGKPEDYTRFGYNTAFQGRMYTIACDILIKQKGWFYYHYKEQAKRLVTKAINEGRAFVATEEACAAEGAKMKVGEWYMKGRKNQSVVMFGHKGAIWRNARILLHIIYSEWMILLGETPRNPYPIEYLGHSTLIKLDDIINFEAKLKLNKADDSFNSADEFNTDFWLLENDEDNNN